MGHERLKQLAFDHAIGQQRLEGLEPSQEAISDLEKVVRGEMTTAEVIERTKPRYSK